MDVYEVPSKSDKRPLLFERNEKSLQQLPKEREGRYRASEIYTEDHQKQYLKRKDIQNADHQ